MPDRRPRSAPPPETIDYLQTQLVIDAHDLEAERRTQHDKFYVVAKQLALAISQRDAAKKAVKEADARLSEEVRANWHSEQNDGRLTEKVCADRVLLHPDMVDAQDELAQAELQVGLWWALKDTYEQRNAALDGLIKLHLAQYYGVERASYQVSDAQAEANRQILADLRAQDARRRR